MTRPQIASRSEVARGLRASVCAATPRRGSLLYKMEMVVTGALLAGLSAGCAAEWEKNGELTLAVRGRPPAYTIVLPAEPSPYQSSINWRITRRFFCLVASSFGNLAWQLVERGDTGRMVGLHGGKSTTVPVTRVLSGKKIVDIAAYYDIEKYRPKIKDFMGVPMFLS